MCESDLCICIFYTAANSIYANTRFASEMSKLQLMESFCLLLLSYGCEVLYISTQQLSQLNACWNNAYRKVFKMNQWESGFVGDWILNILEQRKLIFLDVFW